MILPAVAAFVVDASAILELLADVRGGREKIAELMETEAAHRCTLAFCDLEVLAGMRSMLLRGDVSASQVNAAFAAFVALPITRHDHEPLLSRIWELRDNFTPYDAGYVALAEAFDAPLVTADARLKKAVRRHTSVDVLP